jgi:hypothetical protein
MQPPHGESESLIVKCSATDFWIVLDHAQNNKNKKKASAGQPRSFPSSSKGVSS